MRFFVVSLLFVVSVVTANDEQGWARIRFDGARQDVYIQLSTGLLWVGSRDNSPLLRFNHIRGGDSHEQAEKAREGGSVMEFSDARPVAGNARQAAGGPNRNAYLTIRLDGSRAQQLTRSSHGVARTWGSVEYLRD